MTGRTRKKKGFFGGIFKGGKEENDGGVGGSEV